MKYVFQFMIITGFMWLGELLGTLLPLPVPDSIYGMVLLFLSLHFKVLKLDQIEAAADFFLTIMPLLFVGVSVSLIDNFARVSDSILPFLFITVISTFIVMAVTGKTADYLIGQKKGGKRRRS